jgi:4'-phosphopantetheinyl transferase EntD
LNGLIFSAGELEYMRSLDPGLPLALACTIGFSAKESFFKAVSNNVGFYFDFDALRLDAIDPACGRIHFTVQQNLNSTWPSGRSCSIHYVLPDARHVLTLFLT